MDQGFDEFSKRFTDAWEKAQTGEPCAGRASPGDAESAVAWLRDNHRQFAEAGRRASGNFFYPSGEGAARGAMLTAPADAEGFELRAFLATDGERALREMLSRLPRGKEILLCSLGQWTLRAIGEFLGGEALWESPSFVCFQGVKGSKLGQARNCARSETIAGKKDPALEEFRRLGSLKARVEQSRIVLEGALSVRRALRDGLPVERILATPAFEASGEGAEIFRQAREEGVAAVRASSGLLATVSDIRPVPQVLALVRAALPDATLFHSSTESAIIVTDGVTNPDNLGMALRTADAAGMDAVMVFGSGASPFHKNCLRSARGAVGRIPIFRCADEKAFLQSLRQRGFQIVGSSAKAATDLYEADLRPPVAFVIGSESEGMRKEVAELCGEMVRIPMAGGQSSLNVAVATGVMLFEWRRRASRGFAPGSCPSRDEAR